MLTTPAVYSGFFILPSDFEGHNSGFYNLRQQFYRTHILLGLTDSGRPAPHAVVVFIVRFCTADGTAARIFRGFRFFRRSGWKKALSRIAVAERPVDEAFNFKVGRPVDFLDLRKRKLTGRYHTRCAKALQETRSRRSCHCHLCARMNVEIREPERTAFKTPISWTITASSPCS